MDEKARNGGAERRHESFLTLLPVIESVARLELRRVPHPDDRDECFREAIALAWKWYVRLVERGREPSSFVVTFSRLAVRAVLSGRRLCGSESSVDVMSRTCRRRHGLRIAHLGDEDAWSELFRDALADNTQSAVPT